ncbi:Intraflagellar Transport Protein [Thraustotheca clavata]|uniref:Intraflagellar Transport Protein n=1 Tax=Thraustotheca clavata TaxID=74557 RepID=A0A1W0AAB5_9STRA|nr:Intraflagellar Transport Protein [Thraustotheca clavata]
MALFYDYPVDLPANTRQLCSAWSESEAILAVGLDNREVHFYSDEGEKLQSPVHSRKADVMEIAWQPRGNALAVSWSDGMVSLWIPKENAAREVNSPHTTRINLLKWAPSGNRLITGDENGILAVWKIDARSQMTLATQYTRQGSLTQCVFCITPQKREKEVKGDITFSATAACPSFFFGGDLGSVHYADDLGHISDVQTLNHAIDCMMFYEEQHRLVVITRAAHLVQLQVASDGTVKPVLKVKLSVSGENSLKEAIWAGPGLLATASGEQLIRFWDLQKEENFVLSLASAGLASSDRVSSIDFNPRKRILAAGTNEGKLVFWRCTGSQTQSKATQWLLLSTADMKQPVVKIGWSSLYSYVYAHAPVAGVTVFHEAVMNRCVSGDTAVIQSRSMSMSVEKFQNGTVLQTTLDATIRVKGLAHDGNMILVWNGSKAEVFELQNDLEGKRIGTFKTNATAMQLRGDVVYMTNGNHVQIANASGTVKNSLSFTQVEGKPMLLHVNNKYLTVGTDMGLIRVFDLSRREPKAFGSMGNIMKGLPGVNEKCMLHSLAVNCDGTRVAFLVDSVEGTLKVRIPHTKIYLFNTDLNIFQSFECGPQRHPVAHFWDPQEPRLLACETFQARMDEPVKANKDDQAQSKSDADGTSSADATRLSSQAEKEILILFASNERGVLMQDNFDLDSKYSALLGMHVPRLYLSSNQDVTAKESKDEGPVALLRSKIMRDFVGLDRVDEATRQALIDFSYFMTIGNMDEAYRSVKLIQNASVWENMAHMCVKTKRLDVAQVCLGNMGHARGAAAVDAAASNERNKTTVEVPIAMVAIQLGLLDDAARLYKESGRFDLLNKLYQAAGYWGKAIEVASKRDRIHLKSTHFAYAKHLEEEGNLKEAMRHFELAGTAAKDIPRMLFGLGKLEMLDSYASKTDDPQVLLWWAQYQESNQEFDSAAVCYRRAKDFLSLVRVLCFKKDFDAAAQVVANSNNRAAAYHLARQFEAHDEVGRAIQFYATSGSYSHAIRLSREHNLDGDLMQYALLSKPGPMLECAQYFEAKREYEKAVALYHKGGYVSKAIEICFQAQLFDELHTIADELGSATTTSPVVLGKCADFFAKNQQYAKAVPLLILANRITEALDMCVANKVKITEEMAEKLTPPKPATEDPASTKKRNDLLMKLAKCCKQQGSYHLATKKYTQAGAKLKAMKCLLKSGDTEKVVFFANVSRNNEIFVLAANYLQTLNWSKDSDIAKNIVGFYTKAKAFDALAGFYEANANLEIDEAKDYEKALSFLQNAVKILGKSSAPGKDKRIASLEQRMQLMTHFVQAQAAEPEEMVKMVHQLLEEPEIEAAVRPGDAFGLLVKQAFNAGDKDHVSELLEAMRSRNIPLKNYVSSKILNECALKGTPTHGKVTQESKDDDEMDEEIVDEEEGSHHRK